LSVSASFSGPLPPPEILARYNDAVPDAAERIIAMAEKQAEHRMGLESRVIDADIRRANAGVVAGFLVALAFLGGSVFLVFTGHTQAGVIVGSLDLVGLVSVFVYGTISRRSEREQRAKTMSGQS
jgi:uncharacterized membrane protein